jgi:glycine cleavage system H protein
MPIDGAVVEVNEGLMDTPEVINTAPYSDGWMIKIEIGNADQLNSLMDPEAYQKYCDERG